MYYEKSAIKTKKHSKDEFNNSECLDKVEKFKKSFIKCCKEMNNSNINLVSKVVKMIISFKSIEINISNKLINVL